MFSVMNCTYISDICIISHLGLHQGCGQVQVLGLVLNTMLSVLDVLEYLVGENSKYPLVLVLVLDPKYLVNIKYFSSTVEPLICIYLLTIQVN